MLSDRTRSPRIQRFSISAFALLFLLAPAWSAAAEKPLFEVLPPDKLAFNYPQPPREGSNDYFTIAEGGQARCVVVYPADGPKRVQTAAAGLASYLQLATGARFAVVPEDGKVPEGMARICVGDTRAGASTKLDLPEVRYGDEVYPNLGGYAIQTVNPRLLLIRGQTEWGTAHGVVGFLKRYVGVRQYWPGRPGGIGDVIPSRPTLRVPQLDWSDWPYMFSRSMSTRPFAPAQPPLDFYRRHGTLPCSENYDRWLPPEKYAASHPEYYPLVSGRRRPVLKTQGARQWQPCISNPDVPRIMGQAVTDYFRQNPQAVGINFSINDGGGDCTCERCRAMDAPGTDYSERTGMSDRYVKLSNQACEAVAKEFPGKRIVYLAYATAKPAPIKVTPHPMLLPVLTVPGNAFVGWDEWMAKVRGPMGIYIHHNDSFFILPKFDLRQAVKRLQYVLGSGRARVFYMEMHAQWPFNDVVPYVISELLWDPRQDVRALLDEYYSGFWGPAAEPIRDFHRALDAGYQRWLDQQGTPHWYGKDVSSSKHGMTWEQFHVLPLKECSQAAEALARTMDKAHGDDKVLQRIQILQAMFGLQELAARQYWMARRLSDAKPRSEADALGTLQEARDTLALSRQIGRYIADVLEKPPIAAHGMFKISDRGQALYDELKTGQPVAEVRVAATAAVEAVSLFLRKSLGAARAAAWWRSQRQAEKEEILAAAFTAAEMRAKGVELKNLASDPGYEELGRMLAPDELAIEQDVTLDEKQEGRAGVRQWFRDRSPCRVALVRTQPHSGRWSLLLEHCHRARVSKGAAVPAGERVRIGFWFRHNEGKGTYTAEVNGRREDGSNTILTKIPVADRPGQWQEVLTEFTVPDKVRAVSVFVHVNNQAEGARCWVDDVFIGVYPR